MSDFAPGQQWPRVCGAKTHSISSLSASLCKEKICLAFFSSRKNEPVGEVTAAAVQHKTHSFTHDRLLLLFPQPCRFSFVIATLDPVVVCTRSVGICHTLVLVAVVVATSRASNLWTTTGRAGPPRRVRLAPSVGTGAATVVDADMDLCGACSQIAFIFFFSRHDLSFFVVVVPPRPLLRNT